MATVTINGRPQNVGEVVLLVDLLTDLSLNAAYLAVAVNDEVVPRSEHGATKIKDGDRVEVIHAVGGG